MDGILPPVSDFLTLWCYIENNSMNLRFDRRCISETSFTCIIYGINTSVAINISVNGIFSFTTKNIEPI